MKGKVMFRLSVFLVLVLIGSVASAQLFPNARWNRQAQPQAKATCVGDQCAPVVSTTTYYRPMSTPVQPVVYTPVVTETVLPPPAAPEKTSETPLRRAFLQAVRDARKAGTITAKDAVTLRVSSFSPAFMDQGEQVAVTPMVMSGGDEALPMSADGTIDRASIPWGNFGAFLQKLLPIILELIKLFGL